MVPHIRLLATLVAFVCPLLPRCGAAQETTSPPPDLGSLDRGSEIVVTVDGPRSSRATVRRAGLDAVRPAAVGAAVLELRRPERARRSASSWGDWVAEALTPDAPDAYERFREVFEQRLRAPGSPFARSEARDAARGLPSDGGSDLDLPEFLPIRLREDILRAEARIQELRTVLFGQRGIFRLGEDEESGHSRFRLNLQYDPDPGFRFVLLTR